ISDLGSIGIPPVFHHLYDFGNIPIFLCFGTKIRRMVTDREGKTQERVFMDFTLAMDERICDGYYFSRALRTFRHIFKDPAVLDLPPDNVINDVD
ncbi:MAG: 2-oxo acid dehydrogenase subunit E2, partial [Oscillospiraceae bacterium]|nr:2-oxo acid dehydrogenase subunit E2 [Oscillospiraceae bacterium]